jgi:hypothetical protein
MNYRTMWSVVLSIVVGCAVLLPLAEATDDSQQTEVTFNQPVEIPGRVLPAGTYWFVLTGDTFSRDFVRIYSADRQTVYATILTVETQRPKPADGISFTFAERESSKPDVLLNWYYPGETIGHQFQYKKPEEKELAQGKQREVVVPSTSFPMRAGF